jgi:hypothetical protein
MHHGTAYPHFARSRVSLGGLKYMLGAVVTTMLAEKIKTPEQRYLLMAGVGLAVGLIETGWRDHIRAGGMRAVQRGRSRAPIAPCHDSLSSGYTGRPH